MANPDATGRGEPSTRPAVPKDARIITYHCDTPSLGQARSDCERNNAEVPTRQAQRYAVAVAVAVAVADQNFNPIAR
ncbi:hypothetical protein PRtIB026_A30430 [Pseudomonas sp. RtIB026]|nr:hypothetical protein PRtIB026_A30430 [Pseudomonas sp. RtIB026]